MLFYLLWALGLGSLLSFSWYLGSLLRFRGFDLWMLRGGLFLIVLVVAGAVLWYYLKRRKKKKDQGGGSGEIDHGEEISHLIREARNRLRSADLAGKDNLSSLPLLFVIGKQGTTKTSTVVNSGLEPELLAGQVHSDRSIVPTALANLWFTRRAVIVEASTAVMEAPDAWNTLLRRLAPGGLRSMFGSGGDAPRAALVCVSCEDFFGSDPGGSLAAHARDLRGKLEEASRALGVPLPVYVLFTKMDRVAFFAEYVRNFNSEEAGQVVGTTLGADAGAGSAVYSERQARRLEESFDRLTFSLCDRRPEILAREHESKNLAGAYEFPRELRKFRSLLVQFLVDLGRPSQLRAGPYLRGYYFGGVRALIQTEAQARPITGLGDKSGDADVSAATMVFHADQLRAERQAAQARQSVSRKVPQWVFLSHLFNDVLLGQGATAKTGGSSAKTARWRKVLLATGALVCFIWITGMLFSYFGNRALATEAEEAARAIGTTEAVDGEMASVDSLQRLETLRQSLETLTRYEQDGRPLRLRWGLYTGTRLYPRIRRLYYSRFHQLLFGSAQGSLLATLQRLPEQPGQTDEYSPIYDSLKAYLITTSHPDKSSREFLTPVLLKNWIRNRDTGEERTALATKQFDFYAEDLKISNPFSSSSDTSAVDRGRLYLSQFAGIERVYQFMLSEASRENPSINFNRIFPGSEAVVVNNREVPGAFSKGGWVFMQDAIKHADRFFGGEEWVLGQRGASSLDLAQLEKELGARYLADFATQWQGYLRDTVVVGYRGLGDAATKLGMLSGNQSPLLAALWLASRNTAVDSEHITHLFQPVQFVVSPESEGRYIGESNSGYMQALLGLQAAVEQIANAQPAARDMLASNVNSQAAQAKVITRQVAQNFLINPQAKIETTVQSLMEKPILLAEAMVRSLGPAELNAKGSGLCAQLQALLRKYPFKPDAAAEASLAEVAAIFQPNTGALWTFYEEDLRELLVRQGTTFVAKPGAPIGLNSAFVSFFNRAAAFSEAVYPNGARQPNLAFQLTGFPAEGIRKLNLTVDAQVLSVTGQPETLGFSWPGGGNQRVVLTGQFGGGPELAFTSYQGLWAIFRFFGDADRWQAAGNSSRLEWVLRQGKAGRPLTLPDGRPLTVRFDLQSAAPVFRKEFLAGLGCVSRVAR